MFTDTKGVPNLWKCEKIDMFLPNNVRKTPNCLI